MRASSRALRTLFMRTFRAAICGEQAAGTVRSGARAIRNSSHLPRDSTGRSRRGHYDGLRASSSALEAAESCCSLVTAVVNREAEASALRRPRGRAGHTHSTTRAPHRPCPPPAAGGAAGSPRGRPPGPRCGRPRARRSSARPRATRSPARRAGRRDAGIMNEPRRQDARAERDGPLSFGCASADQQARRGTKMSGLREAPSPRGLRCASRSP